MKILIGVSGGIAAYKALELTSRFRKAGHAVRVVLTEHASEFVTPLSFASLSNQEVITGMFDGTAETVDHITQAKWADCVIIAPATANIIAKISHGIADDFLTTLMLAYQGEVYIAPAMNSNMYLNEFFKENLEKLKQKKNIHILTPDSGYLACGDVGVGRMMEAVDIFSAVTKKQEETAIYGKKILISAGPTREAIDPVRFVTNYSSGKMGYALAEVAEQLGAEVTLVSGPTQLEKPAHVIFKAVQSTEEMYQALVSSFEEADIVIMAAAPADYTPAVYQHEKIKKTEGNLVVEFERTQDILYHLGQAKTHQILVGFAAESNDLLENATKKLKRKNCDMIIANDITRNDAGFALDVNTVHLINRDGSIESLPTMTKENLAKKIFQKIEKVL